MTIFATFITAAILPISASAPAATLNSVGPAPTAIVLPLLQEGRPAKIGFARTTESGRLMPAPYRDKIDWGKLDARTTYSVEAVSAALHLNNTPEVALFGRGSTNQTDQIRMTASDQAMDYVLVYTKDALGRIDGQLLATYSGKVLGELQSDLTEYHIRDLTEKADSLIEKVTKTPQ